MFRVYKMTGSARDEGDFIKRLTSKEFKKRSSADSVAAHLQGRGVGGKAGP